MKDLIKGTITAVLVICLNIFLIYFRQILFFRDSQYIADGIQIFGLSWSVSGIVIIGIGVLHALAIFYACVWYKRPAPIECNGFKEFCSMLYFNRPDKFSWWWYKLPNNKMVLLVYVCTVFSVLIPTALMFALLSHAQISSVIPSFLPYVCFLFLALFITYGRFYEDYITNKKALAKKKEEPQENKKFHKRYVAIVAVTVFIASSATYQYSHSVVQVPNQPLWVHHEEFINSSPASTTTNGELAEAMLQFHLYLFRAALDEVYQGARFTIRGLVYPYDPHLSDTFKDHFLQGFYEDDLRHVMPFSYEFLQHLLQDIHAYFAQRYEGQRYWGLARANLLHTDIFVSIEMNINHFVYIAIHEMAHAFGLGESLAGLFTEEFMGLHSSIQEPLFQQSILDLPPTFIGQWQGGLYYNSTFDRTLLRKLEAVNRADEFWLAAFYSNLAYAQLWDEHMRHHATFDELQAIRGVYAAMWNAWDGHNPAMEDKFYAYTGLSRYHATRQIIHNWRIITGEHSSLNAWIDIEDEMIINNATERFRELVDQFNSFAQIQGIRPKPAVLDRTIRRHHFRYEVNYGSTMRGVLNLLR